MGSICYDFLANSFLFDQNNLRQNFRDYADDQLETELEAYREYVLEHRHEIINDINSTKSALKVFSTIGTIPEQTLLQSALYLEQFILDDPLFKFAKRSGKQSEAFNAAMGMQQDKRVDRGQMTCLLSALKRLAPMVAGNYVKLFPLSHVFEPGDKLPVYYSPIRFSDVLPPAIRQFCSEHAVIRSMQQVKDGWQIMKDQDYTNGLYVGFGSEAEVYENGMMYHYWEQQEFPTDKPDIVEFRMNLAEYPLEKVVWDGWVEQSVNRTAINLVDRTYKEIGIAAGLGSTYITDQEFISSLIRQSYDTKDTPELITARQVLNMKVPFIERIDVDKLMNIRTMDADTFTNFRIELEKQFRELRFVTDEQELRERQENILHDLGKTGVAKINIKLDTLRRKAFWEGALIAAGLAGTVVSGGWSLLAAATAGAAGIKTYNDYKDGLKENPSYLLWKVLKS